MAPYKVVTGSTEDSTELIYRYEEKVFDRDDPSSLNLASMIAVQVALNYGLFCKEIRLRGPLDRADRRFLTEAARNKKYNVTPMAGAIHFIFDYVPPGPLAVQTA